MTFKKKDFILISTIVVAIIIAIWGMLFNQGSLIINSSVSGYVAQIGKSSTECPNKNCKIKITPKSYKINLSKEGYTSSQLSVEIKRSRISNVDYSPTIVPKIKPLTAKINEQFEGRLGQSATGQQFFINQEPITTFLDPLPSTTQSSISPSGKFSAVYVPAELPQIYLLDNHQKSKSLELLEVTHNITSVNFLDDKNLLLDFDGGVIIYNLVNSISETIPVVSGLHIVCKDGEINCLIISPFTVQTDNRSSSSNTNLFSSVVQEEGFNLFGNNSNPTYKLYALDTDSLAYTFLLDLPPYIGVPKRIFTAQNESTVLTVIENDAGKFFQVD